MNVADSSAGSLLDRLERDGFIVRERNDNDRRVIYVKLTEEGDNLISDLLPIGEKFNDDLLKGISEEELAVYDTVLKKMITNISEKNGPNTCL
jgi:DNA-binding MarR family transcriptional regulator